MKFLFITDRYFPKPYANTLCAQNLMEELLREGDRVDTIAFQDPGNEMPEQWNGVRVYAVKPDLRLWLYYTSDNIIDFKKARHVRMLASIISKLRRIFLIPWQPFYSFAFPKRIGRLVKKLHAENDYDCIVTLLNPFDGCYGVYQLKRRGLQVPWFVYAVDTLSDKQRQFCGGRIGDPFFWEKRFLTYCNGFLYMQSRSARFAEKRFDAWREKLLPTDLPKFLFQTYPAVHMRTAEVEHWCYAGSLGAPHYDPHALLGFFRHLPNDKKRILHFYGRGTGIERLREQVTVDDNIQIHGYVSQEELKEILKSADILVSLKTSDQISAKLFEYMSFSKIIVHISGHIENPNAAYIDRYPLGITIHALRGTPQDWVSEYQTKCKTLEKYMDRYDPVILNSLFKMNTPQYSCKIIKERL